MSGVSEFQNVAIAKELFGLGYLTDMGTDIFGTDGISSSSASPVVIVSAVTLRDFLHQRIRESAYEIPANDHLDDKEMFASFIIELIGNLRALDQRSPFHVLFQ
jgi:hypothetical protein